jgi:hypothetical protein
MKRDQQRPAKAAAERCQGACLDIPPAGACDPPLSHIPTGLGAVARTGRRAVGRISGSRKTQLCGFRKKWARELAPAIRTTTNREMGSAHHQPPRPSNAHPRQPWLPPFSHTHRPGCSGSHGPAGCGADFRIPQNSIVRVSQKMGSRARQGAASLCCAGRWLTAAQVARYGFLPLPAARQPHTNPVLAHLPCTSNRISTAYQPTYPAPHPSF